MILEGWNRKPRLAPPTPTDIAAIWRCLSDRQRLDVERRASAVGFTVAEWLDARIRQLQALLSARQPGGLDSGLDTFPEALPRRV